MQYRYRTALYFDLLLVGLYYRGRDNAARNKIYTELRQISRTSTIFTMEDEAWCHKDDNCALYKTEVLVGASLMAKAYAHELILPQNQLLHSQGLYFHLPKTAAAEYFYHDAMNTESARDIDVLTVGALSASVYPLRTRIAQIVSSSAEKYDIRHYHYEHPGYWEIRHSNTTLADTVKQFQNYASILKRANIVITDSSRFLYGVGKYAEIPAAGALVIADMPAERQEDLQQFVVPVHMDMSDDDIWAVIVDWLHNKKERIARAAVGQRITLEKYTNDHSIDIILEAYLRLKRKEHGTWFPYEFSLECRSSNEETKSVECGNHANHFTKQEEDI